MRRQYITHPKFQFGFIFAFIRGLLVAITLPAFGLFLACYLLAQDPSLTAAQKPILLQGCNQLVVCFLFIGVLLMLLYVIIGGFLSYKFAGPIRRIEDWLVKKLSESGGQRLTLRPGDELSVVAKVLNRLFDR